MEQIQIWNNSKIKKHNNLGYPNDPTTRSINRLYVMLFKNDNDDATRDSFVKFYMSLLEVKAFNALIDNKPFFDQQWKTDKKRLKNLSK